MTSTATIPRLASLFLSLALLGSAAVARPGLSDQTSGLPPDPGDAGRATLAGVDANGNGVRDDLERYIARHFGHDSRVQRAVANAVIATQHGILATDDDDSRAAQAMQLHVGDCMAAIAPELAPYGDALWRLRRLIDDTPERTEAMASHLSRVMRMDVAVKEQRGWGERCIGRVDEVVSWGSPD